MKRFLAREITADGGLGWKLAIITLQDDGRWTVEPFAGETHSTAYISGAVHIGSRPGAAWRQLSTRPPVWVLEAPPRPSPQGEGEVSC